MVTCSSEMEPPVVPIPPPLKGLQLPKQPSFRLAQAKPSQDDTESVYSAYKQKIDTMFENSTTESLSSGSPKNCVQAKIEKMFADVAIDTGIPNTEIGIHHFSVDYLGSVPLMEKVTSLTGLQAPLRELYFAYQKTNRKNTTLSGKLEISSVGLKVQYLGDKGDLEQLNSFPTIAVWSAVKFVLHDDENSYAFLPLITDPDNLDKRQLFRSLSGTERRLLCDAAHQPLFAVVMRKIGVHKQLECHAFVCQTSEDAIVIAATLYKSLMSHMKARERRGPKNKNGLTCMSVASSSFNEPSCSLAPVRPPRKKRSNASSIVSAVSDTTPLIADQKKKSSKSKKAPQVPDFDAIVCSSSYEEPKEHKVLVHNKWNTLMSNNQKQITNEIKQVMSESSNMGLKRVKSLRKPQEEIQKENSGDILTKVTIPRSGSFLNAGGLTRYKSKVQRLNGQATGGSPLGFNELFNEFRLQEGLHSLDEILGVIIDPEGMSFNDLKPIYKEFLLKLSVTLTKDELYQRSKSIMRRHRKKLLRRGGQPGSKKKVILGSKFRKLKHVFQKKLNAKILLEDKAKVIETKIPESTISSSSYDTRHFAPKKRRDRQSTSEESDFFSLRLRRPYTTRNHNRHSSSGYVSCSECSFDSDTCTCTSADKCYCSLGNKTKTMTWCSCDTDSCTDSNKCYCTIPRGTILEQLKQRGFPSSTDSSRNRKKRYANTKSSKSLEYVPADAFKGHFCKKSAEIAAVFADIQNRMISNSLYRGRMYSTKNGLYTIQSQSDDSSLVKQRKECSRHTLENSLGYLP